MVSPTAPQCHKTRVGSRCEFSVMLNNQYHGFLQSLLSTVNRSIDKLVCHQAFFFNSIISGIDSICIRLNKISPDSWVQINHSRSPMKVQRCLELGDWKGTGKKSRFMHRKFGSQCPLDFQLCTSKLYFTIEFSGFWLQDIGRTSGMTNSRDYLIKSISNTWFDMFVTLQLNKPCLLAIQLEEIPFRDRISKVLRALASPHLHRVLEQDCELHR